MALLKMSVRNAAFQRFEALRRNREKRTRERLFFVEGVHPIEQAIAGGWRFEALGFAADVYYRQDETKYGTFRPDAAQASATAVQAAPPADEQPLREWPWTEGFKEIRPGAPNWKASVTQVSKMAGSTKEDILSRITAKFNITRENFDELLRVGGYPVAA